MAVARSGCRVGHNFSSDHLPATASSEYLFPVRWSVRSHCFQKDGRFGGHPLGGAE
jgi:hypothetical protein